MPSKRPPPIPPRPPVGRVAGKYELLEIAGRGGMSTVWRAYQHGPGRFRRVVAVKRLYPHLAAQKLFRDMFLEEARIGAILDDPNIAQIFDFLIHAGEYFLIIEWIEGIDLFTYIDYVNNHARRKTEWELMAAVVIGMLRGLAAAHERTDDGGDPQPIIHRDITPHNILIGINGTARLIDFGLSLAPDRHGEDTDPGIAKGKFAYLAPEVVRGERPSPASDQFAAGITLWESLAGRRLFAENNQYETLRRVAETDVPPLAKLRPDLPAALCECVHRALSAHVEDRFASVREMANRLSAILGASSSIPDTYATLAQTVRRARKDMALGARPQGRRAETPLSEEESASLRGLLPALLRRIRG